MLQAWPPVLFGGVEPLRAETDAGIALATVVYRSRAAHPFSPLELHRLTLAAQERNRGESVTGLLLYDSEQFFQWLEGPAESVHRVMRSIRNDPRHGGIEILHDQPATGRRFGGWNMRLAMPGIGPFPWPPEAIKAPNEMVQRLRERPEDAPGLLARLGPAIPAFERLPVDLQSASILDDVIRATVIPALLEGLAAAQGTEQLPAANPEAAHLASLLIASDPDAAFSLIRRVRIGERLLLPLYATLVEPAARSLGDLWSEDACSEFDVTLGLCRLQTAVRQLSTVPAGSHAKRFRTPQVLIAPEPGETHHLGAALDSEVLWHAGWTPHCAYPASDGDLQDLVAATWFDALDLSLSAAFGREHWLPRITDTIARARRASRNPALVVVVGGRAFTEGDAGVRSGADVTSRTALHIDHSILQGLHAKRTERARAH
ncbi:MAG: BLUF domain-containing protein [Acetobacteraceae bacterium]|nr:BLUF domain-containing protein [Acetobacteraceae bacterium]